jgi:hypothetical protein
VVTRGSTSDCCDVSGSADGYSARSAAHGSIRAAPPNTTFPRDAREHVAVTGIVIEPRRWLLCPAVGDSHAAAATAAST